METVRFSKRMLISDQWYIENDVAWFLSMERSELFEVDMKSQKVSCLSQPPLGNSDLWRNTNHCIKYKNCIFCLPDKGNQIWKFNLESFEWKSIQIVAPTKVRLSIERFWLIGDEILLYSLGLHSILRFSLKHECITRYDLISKKIDPNLSQAERVDNDIYIVSPLSSYVYIYHIPCGSVEKRLLHGAKNGFCTICYGGKSFWLSGREKRFYEWDIKSDELFSYPLPASFGIYNFNKTDVKILDIDSVNYEYQTFESSVYVGNAIWWIPYQGNHILYMEMGTREVYVFNVPEEEETYSSIHRNYDIRYQFLYIKDNRYIGIFSYKSECVIEIDALQKRYNIMEYDIGALVLSNYDFRSVSYERDSAYLFRWLDVTENAASDEELRKGKVLGREIYRHIMER